MTLIEIIAAVCEHKPVGRRQIIRYRDALKIKPMGVRQRPQQYPADSAERILIHLGISAVPVASFVEEHNDRVEKGLARHLMSFPAKKLSAVPPVAGTGVSHIPPRKRGRAAGIVTMKQINKARRKK